MRCRCTPISRACNPMPERMTASMLNRQSELVAEIKWLNASLKSVMTGFDHLDGTIGQFSTEQRLTGPRLDRTRGMTSEAIQTMIRTTTPPLTLRKIAERLVATYRIDVHGTMRRTRLIEQDGGVATEDAQDRDGSCGRGATNVVKSGMI